VLIVEDESNVRWTIGQYLRGLGYVVNQAENALSAFERLRRITPDVIVLDLTSPGMDSREFVRALRDRPAFASFPIVLLSAARNLPQLTEELQPRASLAKPVDLDVLAAVVDRAAQSE
jgi:CheY-like chemotaxis protein